MRGCPIDGDYAGGNDPIKNVLGCEWIVDVNDDGGGTSGNDPTVRFLATNITCLQSV